MANPWDDDPIHVASPWDSDPVAVGSGNAADTSHPMDSILHGAKDFMEQVNPVSKVKGIHQAITHPIDTMRAMGNDNQKIAEDAKKAYDSGDYASAVRHSVNYILSGIPGLGSSIEKQSNKFAKGDIAGGVGGSLGLGTDLAVTPKIPAMAKSTGKAIQRGAEPIAETALGISAKQRAFGKTPGRAALDETTGLRPEAVAESARKRLGDIETELTSRANSSKVPASLTPARDLLDQRIKLAESGNSSETPAELGAMREQLTVPNKGFAGSTAYPPGSATPVSFQRGPRTHIGQQPPVTAIPGAPKPPIEITPDQSAAQILRMKREFGNDFTKWNPLHPQREMGTARNVYRELDKELDRTVPGADELNQRTSSLIPVAERSELNDLNAGFLQRNAHRIAAHTGALVGAAEGYRAGGIPGAVAGLAVPELLASPTVRMGLARGANAVGKGIRSNPFGLGASGANAAGMMTRRPEDDPLGLFQ